MRKPDESLDEYVVKPEPEVATVPPSPVSLRFTGEVEVLRPLARWEHPVKMVPATSDTLLRPAPPYRLSWFHRSLAVGGGITMAALVLASAMVIGISDPTTGPETAQLSVAEDQNEFPIYRTREVEPAEVPLASDIFEIPDSESTNVNQVSKASRFRSSWKRHVQRATYRHKAAPVQTHLAVSQFEPTTLVIYVENGVVRSRIERWTVSYSN